MEENSIGNISQSEQKEHNSTEIQKSKNSKKRPLVGPVILIIIGLAFLSNNLGIDLPWEFIWPLLIIIVGILMMFKREFVTGGVIALLIILVVFSLLFSLSNSNFFKDIGLNIENFTAKKINTTKKEINIKSDEYKDVNEIDLSVDIGTGQYNLTNKQDLEYYFQSLGTYNYETFEPVVKKSLNDKKLSINYSTKDIISLFGFSNPVSEYDLNLGNPGIKTNFKLYIGTGKSTVNLIDQQFGYMDANIGTGKMEINITGENKETASSDIIIGTGELNISGLLNSNIINLDAKIGTGKLKIIYDGQAKSGNYDSNFDLGTGSINIELPDNLGYKINASVGTGKIKVNGDTIDDEKNYESENYNTADMKLNMDFDIGTGIVNIDEQL